MVVEMAILDIKNLLSNPDNSVVRQVGMATKVTPNVLIEDRSNL